MYTAPHRPSILHRSCKGKSQATTETFESQHEREQQYWAAKAHRAQQTQDRILRNLYPTPEDKLDAADECRLALDQHAKAKEDQKLIDQAQEDMWMRPPTARADQVPQEGRPWQATTFTAYGSKEEEDMQRRRLAFQIALDNRATIEQNAVRKHHEDEAERRVAHLTVTDESSFWNLGSTNDRWLPPERRRSPRGDGHLLAPGPGPVHMRAPFAAEGQHSMAAQQFSAATSPRLTTEAPGAQRPGSAAAPLPIWAWNEQAGVSDALQGREQGQVGGLGAAQVTPWATEASQYGEAAAADPRQLQRFHSRPAPSRCPFATDRDVTQQQEQQMQQMHQHQQMQMQMQQHQQMQQVQMQAQQAQAQEQAHMQAAAAAAPWAAAPSLRYSSRPIPQPRPYALDAEDANAPVRPSSAYAGSRPATPLDHAGVAGLGYGGAAGRPAAVAQRFGSRPEPQPCPFAVDPPAGRQAWAPPQHLPENRNFPWL